MPRQPWLEELQGRLAETDLPTEYSRRFMEELADHLEDIMEEGMSLEASVSSRLGRPDHIVDAAVEAYKRWTFFGRHPAAKLWVFGVSPMVAMLLAFALACYGVVAFSEFCEGCGIRLADESHLGGVGPTALGCGLSLLTTVLPAVLLAVFYCQFARRFGIGTKWMLASCGALAFVAMLPFQSITLADIPGESLWTVGLGLPPGRLQCVQLLVPLAVGLWFARGPGIRLPRAAQARLIATLLGAACLIGCAAGPYRFGGRYYAAGEAPLKANECQVERGARRPVVDAVGWVVGVPSKIVMLNHRIDNHDVSEKTVTDLQAYLAGNGLDNVKVRVNQYAPCDEWRRLGDNKTVAWPLRYTVGSLSLLGYTLLPGRVFGGDNYNPFTNTISLYSDVSPAALYEGASAKDYAQRQYKGLYAVSRIVPGVGLVWHEARASSEVMGYLHETGTADEIKDGYRTVYPTYVWRGCPSVVVGNVPVVLPALAAGHIAGHSEAARVPDGAAAADQATIAAHHGSLAR